MKIGLIIFVRKPELGKVKTRLAASIGDEKALEVYKELLLHTKNITQSIAADKFVFYHNEIVLDDIWNAAVFYKMLQADGDLGYKMEEAFATIFKRGYGKVLIIGSDCFQLNESILKEALHLLEENDSVIGPANDGGYYLLGMKKLYPEFFINKNWSTEEVYKQTLADFETLNLKWFNLPVLIDVDTEGDLLASKNFLNEGDNQPVNLRSI